MPSNKVLLEKQQIVADLSTKIKNATAGVIIDYKGITVSDDTKMRNELRKAGVDYSVVKNTLTTFAAKETGLDGLVPHLNGTTALAVSSDPVASAKVLCGFAKKNDKIKIKAGFVDGRVINAKEVAALAELPPKEVLIAQVLAGFNAPISGFVNVLNGNIRGLVVALNAIAEKKQSV